MDLVIRSFSYERQPRIINYSPTSIAPDPDAEADFGTPSAILGGFTEPADPEPQEPVPQRVSSSATSARCAPNVAVGIKGIYRNYGRSSRTSSAPTTAPTASAIPARAS